MNQLRNLMKTVILLATIGVAAVQVGCNSAAFTSAKLYLQQENYPQAIQFLEQEISQNPSNAEAHYLLGFCYARDGRFEEMNKEFEASLKLSPKFEKDINTTRKKYWIDNFNDGVRKLQNNQIDEAIKSFETAILIDPENSDTYKNLGYAYIQKNEHDKAIEVYKKAAELEPTDASALLNLGIEYYNIQKFEEAANTMKKVLELEPTNKDAISYLAISYDQMGKKDEALKAYDEALKQNPNDPDLYFNRGRLFYLNNEFEKAARDFEKVVEITPDDFSSIYNVGNSYLTIGDNIQKERKALEEQGGDQAKIQSLLEKENENYQKAKKYLEKAVQLNPEHHNAWYNLMVVYVRLNMKKEAEDAFNKVKELEKKQQ